MASNTTIQKQLINSNINNSNTTYDGYTLSGSGATNVNQYSLSNTSSNNNLYNNYANSLLPESSITNAGGPPINLQAELNYVNTPNPNAWKLGTSNNTPTLPKENNQSYSNTTISNTSIIEIGKPLYNPIDEDKVTNDLISIELIAMEPQFETDGLMLFSLHPATDGPPKIRIWCSPYELNISESFNNTLIDSVFQSYMKRFEIPAQIAQILGNGNPVVGAANVSTSFLGNMFDKATFGYGTNFSSDVGEAFGVIAEGRRFSFPKLWSDSSYVATYNLPIYLQCDNPNSETQYQKQIIEPLQYLLQYTLPRSSGGSTYKWPYFIYAESPGLFILPEGIITSLSVNKTSETLSTTNRPAMIKLDLTITSIREAMPQDYQGNIPSVPLNLDTYIYNLKQQKNTPITQIFVGSLNANISNNNSTSNTVTGVIPSGYVNKNYAPSPAEIQNIKTEAAAVAQTYNIPPSLFLGLVQTESSFNPYAQNSTSGAYGLTQVEANMHPTESGMLNTPEGQLQAGAMIFSNYRSQLAAKYPNLPANDLNSLTLAAYNTGIGNVESDVSATGLPPSQITSYNQVAPHINTTSQQYVENINNLSNTVYSSFN